MITAAIEYHEIIDVPTIDIVGEYLHTNIDDHVIILLKQRLADLMSTVNPKPYRNYIIMNNKGKELLYVKIQKDIYGLLRSAIPFYLNMVKDLEHFGFEINPYNPCVANNIINCQ